MTKRKSLARGLEKLLPLNNSGVESEPNADNSGRPLMVSVDRLQTNPEQPRRDFNEKELLTLSQSIQQTGIIEPLVVRSLSSDMYQIIAGERRLRAAKIANLKEVPVIIKEIENEIENLELALIENLHREDLNPMEEAESFHRLENIHGKTHKEIADLAGRERVSVTNSIRLLKLPASLQDDIRYNRMSAGHGRAILGLINKDFIDQVRSEILTKNITVRQTESLVKKLNRKKENGFHDDLNDKAYFESLGKAFSSHLGGLKVKIDHFSKNKKIEIYYRNNQELELLISKVGVDLSEI